MFAIRLLPATRPTSDGERLGEVVVSDFLETFACYNPDLDGLEERWRERLGALVSGEPAVALRYDPRFAWIVYRQGRDCFVQQRISISGDFRNLSPRIIVTEDGEPVSEWSTGLAAVRRFLATEPRA